MCALLLLVLSALPLVCLSCAQSHRVPMAAWMPTRGGSAPLLAPSPHTGLLDLDRCDPSTEVWCTEGAVVSVRRNEGGPIILPFTATSVVNVWSHLYSAMTSDVRDWGEVEGACFRDLIVGKSPTLNFYQILNSTEPDPATAHRYPRVDNKAARVEAMAVFKAFVHSAQREWGAEQQAQGQPAWGGYANAGMERLRRGVGPEDLAGDVLAALYPQEVPGMLRDELEELKALYDRRMEMVRKALAAFIQEHGTAEEAQEAAQVAGLATPPQYDDDYEALAAQASIPEGKGGAVGGGAGAGANQQGAAAKKRKGSGREATRRHSEVEEDGDAAGAGKGASSRRHGSSGGRGSTGVRRLQASPQDPLSSSSSSGGGGTGRVLHGTASERHWFDKDAVYRHESPRPVVTYTSRNFFSRGVLNEADVLAYILTRYNVTLRVTTFEEPLLEVMELLSRSDVMFGMHGAGWTNALFVKRGATALQLFPFGWRLPDNSTVRGYNYREIVYASECRYAEWVNPHRHMAFFRRVDYAKKADLAYTLHPHPSWELPKDSWPGNHWIYQNTFVDMDHFGPHVDAMMQQAGIKPMRVARRKGGKK